MKKFSVIITIKNEQYIIEKVINSILKQNYPRDLYEIICINDGSSDNTIDILNNLDIDMIISNVKNMGISYSKNVGIEKSSGEYLFFIDSQMVLLDIDCFSLIESIFSNNTDIVGVCGKYKSPYKNDYNIIRDIRREEVFGKRDKALIIDKNNFVSFSGGFSFFKKDIFKKFYFDNSFNNSTGEDLFLIAYMINVGYKFLYEPHIRSYHYHYLSFRGFFKKIILELRLIKNTMISNSKNDKFVTIPYLNLCYSFPLFFVFAIIILSFLKIPLLLSFVFLIPEFIIALKCFKYKNVNFKWRILAFVTLFLKEVVSSFYGSVFFIFNFFKLKPLKVLRNLIYWEISKWKNAL